MPLTETVENLRDRGTATTEEALRVFDELEPVELEFAIGRWRGSELRTGHPMNGWLEASGWYGKEFVDPECVHPLLFGDRGDRIFKVAPDLALMRFMLSLPFDPQVMRPLLSGLTWLRRTESSQARLRMMQYRQKVSATMIYDCLPIHDAFRKVDEQTMMGAMDFKDVSEPFWFWLVRDRR